MKKVILIIVALLVGMIAIASLNNSEISRFGYGLELPFGLQVPIEQEGVFCTMQSRYDEGLPFSARRPSHTCQTADNQLARLLNYALGAAVGVSLALTINKVAQKK